MGFWDDIFEIFGLVLGVFGGYHEKKGRLASSERFDYASPGKGWRKF